MYAIYGLVDSRDGSTFYVGLSDDVYARFIQHIRCDGTNPNKDARIQDMKNANVMVGMPVLEMVEDSELAHRREKYWIRHYYDLGMSLTNQLIPRYQGEVLSIDEETKQEEMKPRLRSKMTLDEQREYVLFLMDQGMTRRKIIASVDGFIHMKVIDAVIAESLVVPVEIEERRVVQPQYPVPIVPDRGLRADDIDLVAAITAWNAGFNSENKLMKVFPTLTKYQANRLRKQILEEANVRKEEVEEQQ